jgi:hypothetical protein
LGWHLKSLIPLAKLSPVQLQERREQLVSMMAELKPSTEIRKRLKLSAVDFLRLIRDTPGLADDVNSLLQAAAVGERPSNFATFKTARTKAKRWSDKMDAAKYLDTLAGLRITRQDGVPTVVLINNQQVNIASASARDLETIMRKAAARSGNPDVLKLIESKVGTEEEV